MRLLLAALVVALAPLVAGAQSMPDWATPSPRASAMPPDPGGGPGGGPGTPDTPTQEVPLDGGLGVLALAGGAYAARRLRRRPAG